MDIPGKRVITLEKLQNETIVKILLTSADAGSCNFNINLNVVIKGIDKGFHFFGHLKSFNNRKQIPKDAIGMDNFSLFSLPDFEDIYFWYKGSYQNIDKTKTYQIDEVFSYDSSGKIGIPPMKDLEMVKQAVLDNEKKL